LFQIKNPQEAGAFRDCARLATSQQTAENQNRQADREKDRGVASYGNTNRPAQYQKTDDILQPLTQIEHLDYALTFGGIGNTTGHDSVTARSGDGVPSE
jgi:hypothetical protein